METVPFESARDFADSPFPVTPIFGAATAPWHQSYPPGIPPEIRYTPRRVEQLLQSAVERYPDRVALRYFRTSHTYQELLDRVRQTAGALREFAWCGRPTTLTACLGRRATDLLELLQHEDFGASAPRGDGRRPTSSTTADHDDVHLVVPRHFVRRDEDHPPAGVLDHGITGISCTKSRSKRDT